MRNGDAILRHLEADSVRLAVGNAFCGFIGIEIAAGSVVARIFLALHLLLADLLKPFG
jgi:hypothetical protein